MEKKFIGFSVEQTSLKIYSYQGPAAADTEGTAVRPMEVAGKKSLIPYL